MKKYTIYLIAGLMATLALLLLSSTVLWSDRVCQRDVQQQPLLHDDAVLRCDRMGFSRDFLLRHQLGELLSLVSLAYRLRCRSRCLKHHSLQLLRRHIRQRRRRLQRPALRFLHDQSARRSVVVRDCQLQHEMVEYKLPAHTHPGVSIHGYSDALKQHNKELFPIRYFIKIA